MTTLGPSLDLLARGGACVLLLLVAVVLVRDHWRIQAARLGAAFALGSAAFAVCSQPGLPAELGGWAAPVLALSAGNNLVFWLFARALFDDGFRLKPWHGALWLAVVTAGLVWGLVLQPAGHPAAAPVQIALRLESLSFAVLA